MTIHIPFNKPCIVGSELIYVGQAVAGGHASGDGPFTRRAQRLMEDRFGAGRILLTTSCTHALEMAALLLEIKPGDEVVTDGQLQLEDGTIVEVCSGQTKDASPEAKTARPPGKGAAP